MNRRLFYWSILVTCTLLWAGEVAADTVLYVDVDAPVWEQTHDGSTWQRAFFTLDPALTAAEQISGLVYIHVARGTYKPDPTGLEDPRQAHFWLVNEKRIFGGYAGYNEPNPDERNTDPATNGTVLSGDLGVTGDPSDNCYFVALSEGNASTARLESFAICGASDHAIYCYNGSPRLTNLLVRENRSAGDGAGLFLDGYSNPQVTLCTFFANAANQSGGAIMSGSDCDPAFEECLFFANECYGYGGAVSSGGSATFRGCRFTYNRTWESSGGAIDGSSLTIRDCEFDGNVSGNHGGAVHSSGSGELVKIFTSRFTGNVTAGGYGGALYLGNVSAQIVNCVLENNVAPSGVGGGLYETTVYEYPLTLTNCLVRGNGANMGGGIYSCGRLQTESAFVNCTIVDNFAQTTAAGVYLASPSQKPALTNCIVWGNLVGPSSSEPAQVDWYAEDPPSIPDVTYTCIQNKSQLDDTSNIDDDPGFVQSQQGDYRLASDASPCHDAGRTTALPDDFADLDHDYITTGEPTPLDLSLYARVVDLAVDMGAYEVQAIADCNHNYIPDECDLDCGTPSGPCDVPNCGQSPDCNGNDVPDECDIAGCPSNDPNCQDCNANGVPDGCPGENILPDCNHNCQRDDWDISQSLSQDSNQNGTPDDCEFSSTGFWTNNADFDQGTAINVNYVKAADELQRNPVQKDEVTNVPGTSPLPYIWVAATGRGTIVRINTDTGKIEGEYWTTPADRPRSPSRTTADLDASCWVGNRDDDWEDPADQLTKGSATKLGLVIGGQRVNAAGVDDSAGEYLAPPYDYCTCEDRDVDGLIRTSRSAFDVLAWPNASGADTAGGVTTAEDECVIRYLRTAGTGLRTIAVDSNNDVWLGGKGNRKHEKRDGEGSNALLKGPVTECDWGGYGGFVAWARDDFGAWHEFLWSAGDDRDLLRLDTDELTMTHTNTLGNYGLGFDPLTGRIWHSSSVRNGEAYYILHEIDPWGMSSVYTYVQEFSGLDQYGGAAKGVAVDNHGDVWVAEYNGNEILRYRAPVPWDPDEAHEVPPEKIHPGPNGFKGTTGVAIDRAGRVWITELNADQVSRYDPSDSSLLHVPLGFNADPYNYSDMTGMIWLHTSGTGTWSVVHDSHREGTEWCQVRWNEEENEIACSTPPAYGSTPPEPDDLVVEVRAADNEAALPTVAYTRAQYTSGNYEPLPNIFGRYIQVRVRFHGSYPNLSGAFSTPSLCNLTVVPVTTCVKGDLNFDGKTDGLDIQPFVDVLVESTTTVGPAMLCAADTNYDGRVTIDDILCFVGVLLDQPCTDPCGGRGLADCNGNGVDDIAEIIAGESQDCNRNLVPDECDIAAETSEDVDADGIPDECEPDCNQNGLPDDKDIADQTSNDVDGNGIPDECEPDCNSNDIPDAWDISQATSTDCNENGLPDECEGDCNSNGVPDDCDIDPTDPDGDEWVSPDCNENEYPDECDIALGPPWGSLDVDDDGIPDECEEEGLRGGGEEGMMMGYSGGDSELGGPCDGLSPAEWYDDPTCAAAWSEFLEWSLGRTWGPAAGLTGLEQYQAMVDKLNALGLPNPWAR